jgi:outer membrane protein OmpA-like peptidoglycan-associated protein
MLFLCLFLLPLPGFSDIHDAKNKRGEREIGYFRFGLTMVRGHIFVFHDGKKVPATLQVLEVRSKSAEELVYSPDTVEGSFFMFLPPSGNYELWVKTDGFEPYKMPLYIPNDTYLYEINQDIHFKSIRLLGNRIGQNVELKNAHYNLISYKEKNEEDRQQLGYDFLLDFVSYTFNFGDTTRLKADEFDKIEQVMAKPFIPENLSEVNLQADTAYDNLLATVESIFEQPETKKLSDIELIHKNEEDKYFFSADDPQNDVSSRYSYVFPKKNGEKLIYKHTLIFSKKNKKISPEQAKQLDEIAELINKNDELFLNIIGHTFQADSLPDKKQFKASAKYTKKVFRYLEKKITHVRKFALIANGMRRDMSNFSPAEISSETRGLSKIDIVVVEE